MAFASVVVLSLILAPIALGGPFEPFTEPTNEPRAEEGDVLARLAGAIAGRDSDSTMAAAEELFVGFSTSHPELRQEHEAWQFALLQNPVLDPGFSLLGQGVPVWDQGAEADEVDTEGRLVLNGDIRQTAGTVVGEDTGVPIALSSFAGFEVMTLAVHSGTVDVHLEFAEKATGKTITLVWSGLGAGDQVLRNDPTVSGVADEVIAQSFWTGIRLASADGAVLDDIVLDGVGYGDPLISVEWDNPSPEGVGGLPDLSATRSAHDGFGVLIDLQEETGGEDLQHMATVAFVRFTPSGPVPYDPSGDVRLDLTASAAEGGASDLLATWLPSDGTTSVEYDGVSFPAVTLGPFSLVPAQGQFGAVFVQASLERAPGTTADPDDLPGNSIVGSYNRLKLETPTEPVVDALDHVPDPILVQLEGDGPVPVDEAIAAAFETLWSTTDLVNDTLDSGDPLTVLEDAMEAGFETAATVINTAVDTYYALGEENEFLKKGSLKFHNIIHDSDGDGVNDTILDHDNDGRADAYILQYSLKENCKNQVPPVPKVESIFVHQWLPPYLINDFLPWATGESPGYDCYEEAAKDDPTHPSARTTFITQQNQYNQYRTSFITSDYIYTPQDETPPGAMFFDREDATPYFGKITTTVEGNKVQLHLWTNAQDAARQKSDRSGVTEPVQFATITINGDTPAQLLTLEVLDERSTEHGPDGVVFVAPIDLSKVILMPPHDLDGDGYWNHEELATLPIANPLNAKSVTGDADGDNCFNNKLAAERQGHKRNETVAQDRTQAENECFKRPWTVTLNITDDEPGLDGITIYDDIAITTNATRNNDEWDFAEEIPPVTRVEVLRVKGAGTNVGHASTTVLCSLTDDLLANMAKETILQSCEQDTASDADAWTDGLYSIYYRVCVMYDKIGEQCVGDKDGEELVVNVVNVPTATLLGYKDLPDIPSHRDDIPAGEVLINFTATHPAHALESLALKVTPRTCCASNGDHLSATPVKVHTIPFTGDTRLVYNETSKEYELTIDTNEWPHWRDLLTNKQEFKGAKLGLTVTTERGGESLNSAYPSGSQSFVKYFNNEPPELQPETPDILVPDPNEANRTIVFRFRYIDSDGQAAVEESVKVTVDEGDGILVDDCSAEERDPEGTELVAGVEYDDSNRIWRCTWDAGDRNGTVDWSATAWDPDGGINSTSLLDQSFEIPDLAPELSDIGAAVNALGTSGPTSVNMTISVHYVDDSDAPAWIRATLTNTEHGTRVLSMRPCTIAQGPPESVDNNLTDAYYCAGVTLPELTEWDVRVDAEDVRGIPATHTSAEPIEVPKACDHCMDSTGFFAPGGDAFEQGINGLNPVVGSVSPPFRPGDDIEDPTGIFERIPTYPDDNPRNYVPDLIDGIIPTDIYTLNEDGSISLKESWEIAVKQTHDTGMEVCRGQDEEETCTPIGRFDALKLKINKNDAFYDISVCVIATCYLQDRDLETLEFRTTPQGFVIGFETDNGLKPGTKFAGRIELDATRLGVPGEGAGTVFQVKLLGGGNDLWVNVTSNPVNAHFGANGIFADEGLDGKDVYGLALADRQTQQEVAEQPVYKGSENDDGASYKACIVGVCFDVPYVLLPQLGIERNAQGEFSACVDLNVKEAGGKQCQKQPDGLPGPDDVPQNPDEAFCRGEDEPLVGSCEDGRYVPPEPSTDPDQLLGPVHEVVCGVVENPHIDEDGRCEDGSYVPPGGD